MAAQTLMAVGRDEDALSALTAAVERGADQTDVLWLRNQLIGSEGEHAAVSAEDGANATPALGRG